MLKQDFQEDFLKLVGSITNKRAKIVIDHIIEYGFITTEDLEKTYNYRHPPRAARDVRESGIPLETFNVKSKEGKTIAAYKFGDLNKIQHSKIAGRQVFPKDFKNQLYTVCKGKCAICNVYFEERYLQIDHRVPYEIGGDFIDFRQNIKSYMLLCASCNRSKSWSCEHCQNWIISKDSEGCLKCYWGNPENYTHIALQEIRKLMLTWQHNEIEFFNIVKEQANENSLELSEYIKQLIKSHLAL